MCGWWRWEDDEGVDGRWEDDECVDGEDGRMINV